MNIDIEYDNNYTAVSIGNVTLHFSYETLIGVEDGDTVLARKNTEWGTTTGKHLNRVQPDKDKRLDPQEFEEKTAERLAPLGVETSSKSSCKSNEENEG